MEIAVDLDGVVWDLMGVFLELHKKIYKSDIKFNDVTSWYHFPQEEFEAIYPLVLKRIGDFPFLDLNISNYLFYLNQKHDVKILTQEANSVGILKRKLEEANIIEGSEYNELIRIDRFNGDKLSIKFDVYIDDCPLLVDKMKKYPDRFLLLYDQPWNWDCDCEETHNVVRVKKWYDIIPKIEAIEKCMLTL